MGENPKARDAIDRLTKRIVEHGKATGTRIDPEKARKRAMEAAKRHDRKNQ